MSSPAEKKISYGLIDDNKASETIHALVDGGLISPRGIALDTERMYLYVVDSVQHKLFHWQLQVLEDYDNAKGTSSFQMSVKSGPTTIVENVISQWVTVDPAGNVLYSVQDPPDGPAINKIYLSVVEKLLERTISASDISDKVVTDHREEVTEGEGAAEQAAEIIQLYNGNDKGCAAPGGLASDGSSLFWTNQKNGLTQGSVNEGRATSPPATAANSALVANNHESVGIINKTASAFGLVVTNKFFIFASASKAVYATCRTTHETKALSAEFATPRGVAWDGEKTLFVADRGNNVIWSLPCGTLETNRPLTKLFDINNVFGLAVLPSDKASKVITTTYNSGEDGIPAIGEAHNTVSGIAEVAQSFTSFW